MMDRTLACRMVLTLAMVLLAGQVAGCGGGGEPKIVNCACGNESGDNVDFELSVGMVRGDMDPPQMDENFQPKWDLWITNHYEMRDAAGDLVPLKRVNNTRAIPQVKHTGAEEFFIRATLKKGETYTIDVIPRKAGTKRYRREFVASAAEFPFKRRNFAEVSK